MMRNACARHEKPEARSQRPKRVCLEEEGLKFLAFSLRASRATSFASTHRGGEAISDAAAAQREAKRRRYGRSSVIIRGGKVAGSVVAPR